MKNIPEEIKGTNKENELAQQYYNFVIVELKGKIDYYLQTNGVKRSEIQQRISEIQSLYIKMVTIQYNISQIIPNTILKYTESGNSYESNIVAYAIDEQAKNWLNRLSSTLNVLTIKASEFNEIDAKKREKYIFVFSVLVSTIIGVFTTWYFDKGDDIKNQTYEIKKYQDSITLKIRQEYILNFDTLKQQHQQQFIIERINNNKIDTAILQNFKIIENQKKTSH